MNSGAVAVDHCVDDITFQKLEGFDEAGHCGPHTLMTPHRAGDFKHIFFAFKLEHRIG